MLTQAPSRLAARIFFTKQGIHLALLALTALLLVAGCTTGTASRGLSGAVGGSGDVPGEASPCSGQPLAPDWPGASSENPQALLDPFLACVSPGDFLALQQRVDMPWLVARLDPWSAVRLGALGPVREEAARALNRQRTAFLLQSLEHYGPANTEVLAHFVLDSCHDDDLRDILFLLAQDKRLVEVLEHLPSLGPALEVRGLRPSAHAERDLQWSDVGRGLSRAARDALSTSPAVNGAQSTLMALSALKAQLPPPYQQALDAVEHEQLARQFSADTLAVGFVDHMTFGVPLGFYGLVVGTGHGAQSLAKGRYEQAVRELAPAAVLVALYTGGMSVAWLAEARAGPGVGVRVLGGWEGMASRVKRLQDNARQLGGLLGEEGVRALAGYIRARRDAGRLVAVGGMDAALALHEARGDVAQAQAMLSKTHPEATGSSKGKGGTARVPAERAALAAWVDEGAGLTREVVEAKLATAELEATSPRLSKDVGALEQQRPSVEAPPPEAQGNPRWNEYVAYYERRVAELREGKADKGPLRWEAYERMWGWFTRGLDFERAMVKLLKEDAARPRAQRRFLGDFDKPRIATYVGVKKPGTGLRFADVLIIEEVELAGGPPRVEAMSFKSRDLSGLKEDALKAQLLEDAREARWKYGETLDVRRDALQPLLQGWREVPVQRVRLIYEGGALLPYKTKKLNSFANETQAQVPGVEVLFQ